jgi:hypothetical protein
MKIDLNIDYSTNLVAVREEKPSQDKFVSAELWPVGVYDLPDGFDQLMPSVQLKWIAAELEKEGQ